VDLNRNWDAHWDGTSVIGMQPGAAAFSEPETSALRDDAQSYKPDMFVSVHSGSLGLFTPHAYSADPASEADQAAMTGVLNSLNPKYCNCGCGPSGSLVGYKSPGTSLDYMYDVLGVKFSMAVEIFDGLDSGPLGYKSSGFVESRSQISRNKARSGSLSRRHRWRGKQQHQRSPAALEPVLGFVEQDPPESAKDPTVFTNGAGVTEEPSGDALFPAPTTHEEGTCAAHYGPLNKDSLDKATANWAAFLVELIAKVYAARTPS